MAETKAEWDIQQSLDSLDHLIEHYRKMVSFWDKSNETEREMMRPLYLKLSTANRQHVDQIMETSKEIIEQERPC
jgi:hypothetical protein